MIKPAKRQSLYEEVSEQLVKMISDGEWKPGEKIIGEIELSKEFQVSRNSIRESIKALELFGVLESKTGVGTFVSKQAIMNINAMHLTNLIGTESSLVELMETRLIIEPGLAYMAVKKATPEDIAELEAILEQGKKAVKEKNYTFDLGFAFHKKMFSMSGNKILINLMESITGNLIMIRGKVFFQHLSEYILNYELNEHTEILECFKRGDPVLAKNMMQRHIEGSLNIILEEQDK